VRASATHGVKVPRSTACRSSSRADRPALNGQNDLVALDTASTVDYPRPHVQGRTPATDGSYSCGALRSRVGQRSSSRGHRSRGSAPPATPLSDRPHQHFVVRGYVCGLRLAVGEWPGSLRRGEHLPGEPA
jgi:hypothetical protein